MLSDLPEVLSGEQVRCTLHISKRKCAWMLDNGFIKCQNTGKKTRKYTVLKEDLITYINDSARHPENYVTPYAEFSTCKHTKKKAILPSSLPVGFKIWLEKEFETIADTLTISKVIAIIGYTDNSVERWLRQGHLRYVQTQNEKIIAKDWLIDFLCTYGYTISKKSNKHVKLVLKFIKR